MARPEEKIGPYRLLSPPQPAGDRLCYHAVHGESGEPAAVFVVSHLPLAVREQMRRRFHARRSVRHPNIARLLGEGLLDSLPWYATELHPGQLLERSLDRVSPPASAPRSSLRIPPSDTLVSVNAPTVMAPTMMAPTVASRGLSEGDLRRIFAIGFELCEALTALHSEGFLHGSLGLDTVLVRDIDGTPVLIDPGLLEPGTPGSQAARPPELLAGEPLGVRADVYALGALLYELLAGRAPVSSDPAMLASRSLPGLGVAMPIARLIERMLAVDPAQRPAQPSDCALELSLFLRPDEQPTQPRFLSTLERSAGRPALLQRCEELLFGESSRGVVLRVDPRLDMAPLLEAIGFQARRREFEVLRCGLCEWRLPLAPFVCALGTWQPRAFPGSDGALTDDLTVALSAARVAHLDAVEQALPRGPLLVIVEEVDVTDELSRAMLRRLLRGDPRVRVLLTSGGPHGLPAEGLHEVEVGLMSEGEIDDLLRSTLAVRWPPKGLVKAMRSLGQEEPWQVEQQLDFLIERGALARDDVGVWRLSTRADGAPFSLLPTDKLIAARLARLDEMPRRLLATAALLRRPVPSAWLLTIAGLTSDAPEGHAVIDWLLRRRWLSRGASERVSLVGRWLAEPAAALLDAPEQQAIHARAAQLFESSDDLWASAMAAHHRQQTGALATSAALRERAGALAWRMGAPREALRLWRQALDAGQEARALAPIDLARLHRRIGLALLESGEIDDARRHAALSLRALEPQARGWATALADAVRGATASSDALSSERARSLALQARLAARPAERALAAVRALQQGSALPTPPRGLSWAYGALGELASGLPLAGRALERAADASQRLGDELLDARCWAQQGEAHLSRGRWSEAERSLGRAIDRAHAAGDQALWLRAVSLLSLAWLLQGELPRCLGLARLLRSTPLDEPGARWADLCVEAEVALHQGRDEQAAAALQPACAGSEPATELARPRGLLALALWRLGRPHDALAAATLAAHAPSDLIHAEAMLSALDALHSARSADPAHAAAARALRGSLERLADLHPILRPRLALLADDAPAHLGRALSEARRMETPYALALALRQLGLGRHDVRGEQALREAEALLTRLRSSRPPAFASPDSARG